MNILIRDIPDDVAEALRVHAAAARMSREEWVREMLVTMAREPIRWDAYTLYFSSDPNEEGEKVIGHITRRAGTSVIVRGGTHSESMTPEQQLVFHQAGALVSRNRVLDRERAIIELRKAFPVVYEVLGDTAEHN